MRSNPISEPSISILNDDRTRPKGRLQGTAQPTFDLMDLLRGDTELTANTTDGDKATIRVPHSILAVLVVIALAVIGGGVALVRSLTKLEERTAAIQNQNLVLGRAFETEAAYVSAETNRVNFVAGMLTKQQQSRLFEFDRANPRPERPRLAIPKAPEENQ